jgi:hypothetical protein
VTATVPVFGNEFDLTAPPGADDEIFQIATDVQNAAQLNTQGTTIPLDGPSPRLPCCTRPALPPCHAACREGTAPSLAGCR